MHAKINTIDLKQLPDSPKSCVKVSISLIIFVVWKLREIAKKNSFFSKPHCSFCLSFLFLLLFVPSPLNQQTINFQEGAKTQDRSSRRLIKSNNTEIHYAPVDSLMRSKSKKVSKPLNVSFKNASLIEARCLPCNRSTWDKGYRLCEGKSMHLY